MISVVVISKDEAELDETLSDVEREVSSLAQPSEIVVVDASNGRLDYIRQRHAAAVRWLDFQQPPGVRVTIPHQRNVGVRAARGDIIVFTDAACRPREGWLARLVAPLREEENVVSGITGDPRGLGRYELTAEDLQKGDYLRESSTLNFAFRREVFDAVGGFDETFAYGSDIDFSWRLTDLGYRILRVRDAVLLHDWGTPRRQRRRSYLYGKARARLYRKHKARRRHILRDDPMVVVYPLFLLGLPLTLVFPLYPLLLLIPAWRNRHRGAVQVLVDHLWFGVGVLAELAGR
jgi:glycosyltransferase involved in cell wall biosynthesis